MANTRMKEEPAFPSGTIAEGSGCSYTDWHDKGMSLRDYFAAHAMMGELASNEYIWKDIPKNAYELADAMLKARGQ